VSDDTTVTIHVAAGSDAAGHALAEALRVCLAPDPVAPVSAGCDMLRRGTPVVLDGRHPGVVLFADDAARVAHVAGEDWDDVAPVAYDRLGVDPNDATGQYHLGLWLGDRILQSMDDPQTVVTECGSVGWTLAGNGDGYDFSGLVDYCRDHRAIYVPGLRGCLHMSRAEAIRRIVMHVMECPHDHPAMASLPAGGEG